MKDGTLAWTGSALAGATRTETKHLAIFCLAVLGGPGLQSAWAGCCDELLSCAAAAATSGGTCVLTGRINTVNELIRKVDELRPLFNGLSKGVVTKTQQGVETAAVQISTEAHLLQTRLSSTDKIAVEVTRWPVAKGPSIGQEQPLDDVIIQAELRAALEEVERLAITGKDITASILVLAQQANKEALEGAQSPRTVSNGTALAILDAVENWLRSLLTDADGILDPTSTLDPIPDSIANDLGTFIDQIADAITAEASKHLRDTELLFKQASEVARCQRKIENAMEDLQLARTAESLKLLYDLVPVPQLRGVALQARESGSGAVSSRLQITEVPATPELDVHAVLANLATIREQAMALPKQGIREVASGVTQMKAIALQARTSQASPSTYHQNFRIQLDAYFKGNSHLEPAELSDDLLAQARERFANDPELRDAVVKLISEETGRRPSPLQMTVSR